MHAAGDDSVQEKRLTAGIVSCASCGLSSRAALPENVDAARTFERDPLQAARFTV